MRPNRRQHAAADAIAGFIQRTILCNLGFDLEVAIDEGGCDVIPCSRHETKARRELGFVLGIYLVLSVRYSSLGVSRIHFD